MKQQNDGDGDDGDKVDDGESNDDDGADEEE